MNLSPKLLNVAHKRLFTKPSILTSWGFFDTKSSQNAEQITGSISFQYYGEWERRIIGNGCEYRTAMYLNEDALIPKIFPLEPSKDSPKDNFTFWMPMRRRRQNRLNFYQEL